MKQQINTIDDKTNEIRDIRLCELERQGSCKIRHHPQGITFL
jgi:hypothetical protein